MSVSTELAYEHCRRLVRTSGSSFYAGMRILPADRREAIFAVYALARRIDDIADGVGREVAISEQVGEGRVAFLLLIDSVRSDQAQKGAAGKVQLSHRRRQPLQDRVLGLTRERALEVLLEPVELREAISLELVPDLVGQARKAVDRRQVGARSPPQQGHRHGEVLVGGERKDRLLTRQVSNAWVEGLSHAPASKPFSLLLPKRTQIVCGE
jgi:hypothetical protein